MPTRCSADHCTRSFAMPTGWGMPSGAPTPQGNGTPRKNGHAHHDGGWQIFRESLPRSMPSGAPRPQGMAPERLFPENLPRPHDDRVRLAAIGLQLANVGVLGVPPLRRRGAEGSPERGSIHFFRSCFHCVAAKLFRPFASPHPQRILITLRQTERVFA